MYRLHRKGRNSSLRVALVFPVINRTVTVGGMLVFGSPQAPTEGCLLGCILVVQGP